MQVQKELQTLRAKANDAEQKLKKNDKIRVLEEEKEWYRKEVCAVCPSVPCVACATCAQGVTLRHLYGQPACWLTLPDPVVRVGYVAWVCLPTRLFVWTSSPPR